MSDFQSLLFYVIFFTLSAFLVYAGSLPRYENFKIAFTKKFTANILTLIGLLIPILIGGLLYNVGVDYEGYIRLFEKSNELDYAGFLAYNDFWTVEPSFYILARISMFATGSPWLMFFVYASINVGFFYLFLKKLIPRQRWIGIFIYLFVFFLFTMTLMRQGAAIALCFYALTYLIERKNLKFFALIALASLVHFSALFFLIVWFIKPIIKPAKPNWMRMLSLVAVGVTIIASSSLIQLVTSIPPFDKYVYLLSKSREDILIGWTLLLQLSLVAVISIFYHKVSRKYANAALLYAMLLIGIIAYSLNFRIDYASRLSYFFLPVSTVLLPYSINIFKNNRILITVMLLGCVAYFIKVYYLGNTLMVFPYNFIWSA